MTCSGILQLLKHVHTVIVTRQQIIEYVRGRAARAHDLLDTRFHFMHVLAEHHRARHSRAALDRM